MSATRVLAVEDERIVAMQLKQQLLKLGYEVPAIAASGPEALYEIADKRPDLVLMDIHIDGPMDGIDTAANIPPELDIPVIYLTAYSEEATLERARATKPYGYLIKPYSERELHATIQMALERREVESALRASEDRFRSIFGAISEGIFIVDAETKAFTQINDPACAMFGYQRGELLGETIKALSADAPPYTGEGAEARIADALNTGLPQRFDWRCKTKDGALFWADVSIRLASIGGRNALLAIARDLTERRQVEEQLREAQKMEAVGQLTGGIAHDFNNLLGVIIGNLDLLRHGPPDEARIEDLSSDALNAALSGAELTRRLLAFARRQPLQPQSVDLNELVASTAKLLRRVIGEAIEIQLKLDGEACWVIADRAQLEAALTNLAMNARDAMPKGGRLLITTGRQRLDANYAAHAQDVTPGDYAMVEVTDTGEGIPAEVLNRIFEPFFTTKGRERGTGLGLSMVFGFLKQSGGHVSVYSEVGVGTTFRLYLPSDAKPDERPAAASTSSLVAGEGETVLVVEDGELLRRVAVRNLEGLGYRVLQAANAAEALARLEEGGVDLVFTDVVMPGGMDGVELARLAAERWPRLKIVMTSGFPESHLTEAAERARFWLLTKPYRKADLARIMRAALGTAEPTELGA